MTRTTSFLALAALLLAPGLAGARSAPATTDQARLQAAERFLPAAPAAAPTAAAISSTDLARAASATAPHPGLTVDATATTGPIQSTDEARAAVAARAEATLVSMALSTATVVGQAR